MADVMRPETSMEPSTSLTSAVYLPLATIFKYLHSSFDSRNVIEGESLLMARFLVSYGYTSRDSNKVSIFGLCLQTSALKSPPHEISGDILLNPDAVNCDPKIENFVCSCTAGQSYFCKHIATLLLQLNRVNIHELEKFSKTDLQCQWVRLKGSVLAKFEAKPLIEFCHVKSKPHKKYFTTSAEELEFEAETERLFLEAAPDCALAKHRKGRSHTACHQPRLLSTSPSGSVHISDPRETLLDKTTAAELVEVAAGSQRMQDLEPQSIGDLPPCCASVYSTMILSKEEAVAFCLANQGGEKWQSGRMFRITGNRCYNIYTYGQGYNVDWGEKARKHFWPGHVFTSAMIYGMEHEKHAREAYVRLLGDEVVTPGLLIPVLHPWLGYSADGVVYKNGKPWKLLEIKCPVKGKSKGASDLLDCKYFYLSDSQYCLKKRHQYYGQVQLGMSILDLEMCDLVLYSSLHDEVQVVQVPFDKDFASEMLSKLKHDYFHNMLHYICHAAIGVECDEVMSS